MKPIKGSVLVRARASRVHIRSGCTIAIAMALCGCAQISVKTEQYTCVDNATCTQAIQLQSLFGKPVGDLTLADLPSAMLSKLQPCALLLDYGAINVAGTMDPKRVVTWQISQSNLSNADLRFALVFDSASGIAFTDKTQTDFVSPTKVSDTVYTWNAVTPGSKTSLTYGVNFDIQISSPKLPATLTYQCKADPVIVNSL